MSCDLLHLVSPENDGTKNENEIRSVIGIRRTEIGIRTGTDGTRTGNDPGTWGSGSGLRGVLSSPSLYLRWFNFSGKEVFLHGFYWYLLQSCLCFRSPASSLGSITG